MTSGLPFRAPPPLVKAGWFPVSRLHLAGISYFELPPPPQFFFIFWSSGFRFVRFPDASDLIKSKRGKHPFLSPLHFVTTGSYLWSVKRQLTRIPNDPEQGIYLWFVEFRFPIARSFEMCPTEHRVSVSNLLPFPTFRVLGSHA